MALALAVFVGGTFFCASAPGADAAAKASLAGGGQLANLALVAVPSTSYVSGHETIQALNDGNDPRWSGDKRHGAYGNWPRSGVQWVQYTWTQPVSVNRMEVYWFDDHSGVRLPTACRLQYWDGAQWVPVANAVGLGLAENQYNATTFDEVTTTRLRLEFDSNGKSSTGLLEWKVYDSGKTANFPPTVVAGEERVVMLTGNTWLEGQVKDDGKPPGQLRVAWSKVSGPGKVTFAEARQMAATARFSAPGEYTLKLTAHDGQAEAADTLKVWVEAMPAQKALSPVSTHPYQVTSPLWRERLKKLIVNWIPHCYRQISDPAVKEGGIENFTEAGNKLAGRPFKRHQGAVFANAWVHNTVEAMCVALMVDPQGDAEIVAAQTAMRTKLEDWIPKILSAQEPDGYLQTCYTLGGLKRWSNKADHEGYLAGYFLESAIAHYLLTGKQDARMYNAAKRLADCWVANIGPAPKRAWYEGHQELEQALVRFAHFVEENEGPGKGRAYVDLAKFLLDSRKDGDEYDQSHRPVTRQYEAVGNAVRAVYSYSGMAAVAIETGDVDYFSAVQSIWHNLVNKKYYVTGGVGSGETSEGFGKNFSLPNHAYCESCAGCGALFFQHKLNLIHREARYADLYEESLFNAILGSVDLEGQNFTYTNPLDMGFARYKWHVCPCCVGNIPRTLLMLPTWMYARAEDGLFVNLYLGSKVRVGTVAGTEVEMVQTTDYPWNGAVSLTVNPAQAKRFALHLRVPNRGISQLYTNTPAVGGLVALSVNGQRVKPVIRNGYAVLTRKWQAGDKIEMELPLVVQRIKADSRVAATAGQVALRYGPLIYNFEAADQDLNQPLGDGPWSTEWRPDLLGGVRVIKGQWANGTPSLAIPNYARNNRGGRSLVWVKDGNKEVR
jgi:DUF1680 family protein